ncbi:hypothetical protein [Devosia sp.]|uniref:hypothetical protein n=1 Tax=Devosia sp. TaxID=1871048 RepID=UPI003FA5F6F9
MRQLQDLGHTVIFLIVIGGSGHIKAESFSHGRFDLMLDGLLHNRSGGGGAL